MLKIWLHLIGLTCFWVEIFLISVFSTALLIWFCHIWSLRLSGHKTMCDKNTHMPPNMFQFLVFGDCSLYYSQIYDMKWNVWWRICSSVKHCSCSAQLTPEKKVTYTHIVHPIGVLKFRSNGKHYSRLIQYHFTRFDHPKGFVAKRYSRCT